MGRSGGGNTKVMAANAKKAEAQAAKDAQKAKEQEKKDAAAWAVGSNQRGASRQQAAADKQAEKMRKDAEKKALEAEEDAAASKVMKPKKKKKDKDDVSALLMAGLDGGKKKKKAAVVTKSAEKEKQTALRLAQEEAMRKKGVVLQGDDLMRANRNRDATEDSATGLDNALNMLGMEEKEKSKNLKVLFNEFSERETPKIRADNPGLKLSQVKERVFRAWEKSPDNPKNQV